MALLKAGGRWSSSVCDTEVIVVKGPENDVSLTCGGVEMVEAGGDPVSGELDDSGDGTQLGKRYVDEEDTIEVLCTKPGSGSLGVDGKMLELKDAKPLPASD
ncbi:MAG: hypothetical protein CL517_03530 [Actinobacteria bacterium]|nr:hypothetical protein [Actinomycetota bacterium]|tara:strand:- start:29031 stop:29336 length:306 start_codon:yes stop_codon:yes gene_type:complete